MHHKNSLYLALMVMSIIILALFFTAYIRWLQPEISTDAQILDFNSCAATPGNKILESYPRRCVTQDGVSFVEETAIRTDPSFNIDNLVPPTDLAIDFETCSQLPDSIVQYSYPGVCVTKDGQQFVQVVDNEDLTPPSDTTGDAPYYPPAEEEVDPNNPSL